MLELARRIALESGALLRERYHSARTIDYKFNVADLVTDADKASEALLVEAIRATYPDHNILGEEGTGERSLLQEKGVLWVIDPLDGTVNYAHQLPMFAVSIGVLVDGVPTIGVVYLPILDELFCAERGKGATLNGKPISVSSAPDLNHSVLATGFPYDKWTSERNNTPNVARIIPHLRGLRRMGAAAVDLAYVAAGKLDGYWEEKLNPWDAAAGLVLVEEAGGRLTDYADNPANLEDGYFVATNGRIHQELLNLLEPYARKHGLGYSRQGES
jgi:myo-inositol-1(or 4)-monophosphatase